MNENEVFERYWFAEYGDESGAPKADISHAFTAGQNTEREACLSVVYNQIVVNDNIAGRTNNGHCCESICYGCRRDEATEIEMKIRARGEM